MKTVAISLFVLLLCRQSTNQSDCSAPNCTAFIPGDYVADNLDCHNYFVCLSDGLPSDQPVTCPDGQYFDPDEGIPSTPGCQEETTPCIPNCQPPNCYPPVCDPLDCKGSFIAYGNPNNCSRYFACMPDCSLSEFPCEPPNQYFDPIQGQCGIDSSLCCNNCLTICPNKIVQIPHPSNCTLYYLCEIPGVPTENELYNCPLGEIFDAFTGRCVPGDSSSCTPVCP